VCPGNGKTLTEGNYTLNIRNLEAAANSIPIINNTVIEPPNSFVPTNTKSKAETIIITIPIQ